MHLTAHPLFFCLLHFYQFTGFPPKNYTSPLNISDNNICRVLNVSCELVSGLNPFPGTIKSMDFYLGKIVLFSKMTDSVFINKIVMLLCNSHNPNEEVPIMQMRKQSLMMTAQYS